MSTLTLGRQGNSVGVTFPSDIRIRMGFEAGQELSVVERADGVKLVKRDPIFAIISPDTRNCLRPSN